MTITVTEDGRRNWAEKEREQIMVLINVIIDLIRNYSELVMKIDNPTKKLNVYTTIALNMITNTITTGLINDPNILETSKSIIEQISKDALFHISEIIKDDSDDNMSTH